jgi:hypothetical protein
VRTKLPKLRKSSPDGHAAVLARRVRRMVKKK